MYVGLIKGGTLILKVFDVKIKTKTAIYCHTGHLKTCLEVLHIPRATCWVLRPGRLMSADKQVDSFFCSGGQVFCKGFQCGDHAKQLSRPTKAGQKQALDSAVHDVLDKLVDAMLGCEDQETTGECRMKELGNCLIQTAGPTKRR